MMTEIIREFTATKEINKDTSEHMLCWAATTEVQRVKKYYLRQPKRQNITRNKGIPQNKWKYEAFYQNQGDVQPRAGTALNEA